MGDRERERERERDWVEKRSYSWEAAFWARMAGMFSNDFWGAEQGRGRRRRSGRTKLGSWVEDKKITKIKEGEFWIAAGRGGEVRCGTGQEQK